VKPDQNDPLVVRTADLARVLRPIIREQDEVYDRGLCREALGRFPTDEEQLILSGVRMIEERCDLQVRRIFASRRSPNITLGIADEILTKCGLAHFLQDGTVPVYRSSRWSIAGWEREMRARGVEDPWVLVEDERPTARAA
jgi:hypothetical protein